MADIADSVDITTDLNGQSADAVPYHGGDVPASAQPSKNDPPAADTGEKQPGLRDLLSDAFKKDAQTDVPQPDATKPQPNANEPVPEPPDDLVKVGERWHRKDGSFASKDEITAHEAATAAAQGAAPPVALPEWASQLTPVEREQFTGLPAETRQFVERTMEQVIQQSAVYQDYGLIEQVIGPRRQAWAANGMPPAAAIQQLFALSDFAGNDPGQFVMWFADQHRLDLDALLDARDAAGNTPSDPAYVGLQQELAQLRNAITGMTQQTTGQQHAQNLALVQAFADERDDKGNLLHPYFGELGTEIQTHVAAIRQQQPFLSEKEVLKAAYDFATYSNQSVRQRIQESQAQALKDTAAAEAAKARQAGVSINGGPAGDAGTVPNNANRTLRDELVSAYNQSTLQ